MADRFSRLNATFRDPALVQAALDLTFAKDRDSHGEEFDVIRGQDVGEMLGLMLKGADTQEAAYRFVVRRWKDIREKAGPFGAERIIRSLAAMWNKMTLDHMKKFFPAADNHEPQADCSFKQSVEFVENGLVFKQAAGAAAGRWLAHSTMMARDSRRPKD